MKETIRKDLKILVKRGEIEAHQQTVVLDGKWYSPMVYGSLDGFLTDVEQAEAILAAIPLAELMLTTLMSSTS